jgi:tartrate dehydratase alpha subunit/fumarate hydratase class I-like protein
MREIHVDEIRDNVAQICLAAAYNLSDDVIIAFDRAIETETAPGAKEIIELLKENARIAREEHIPICQDTGIAIFFVEIGQDLRIKNGFIVARGIKKVISGSPWSILSRARTPATTRLRSSTPSWCPETGSRFRSCLKERGART